MAEYHVHIVDGIMMGDQQSSHALPAPPIEQQMEQAVVEIAILEQMLQKLREGKLP